LLGGAEERILDQHALKAVHDTSFGIPGRISAVVEQALGYAIFDHKRSVTAEMALKTKSLQQP
jgi:type II secretory pathway predicted ATPase ExeA